MGYYLWWSASTQNITATREYDDLIVVKTSISELQSRGLTFHYAI